MRHDAIGLFWQDIKTGGRGSPQARSMPPIPETGWVPSYDFPDLSRAPCICVDVETYDPDLIAKGPGWATKNGRIVGVAIGVPSGGRWYYPISHEVEPDWNMDKERVYAWLSHVLGNPEQDKIGANILYDYGWLLSEGVTVEGQLIDVQYAESLLVENGLTNLDYLGKKYCNEGKESDILYDWCSQYYGGAPTSDQRKNIYRAPPRLVGPYALSDVDLPLRVAMQQYPMLHRMGLLALFDMECRLIKVCHAMRQQGVQVDVAKAEELSETLGNKAVQAQLELNWLAGGEVKQTEPASLARAFDKLGITYSRTKTGKPSFTKGYLDTLDHPIGAKIRELRQYEKLKGTFVDSYILNSHVDGRVYGQFHALRDDRNGTRSGRFASSTPNLQNIPSRDKVLAPLIRGLFIPDKGHRLWRKYDYSQIEYRFLVHFAVGPSSDEARQQFCDNPSTDYHDFVLDMVQPYTGWDLRTEKDRAHWRKPLKTINFGLVYGMMQKTLARTLGLSEANAKELFAGYHKAIPYAKATMEAAEREAQTTGEIRTILNRRSPFDFFEPIKWRGQRMPALPYDRAVAEYGPAVKRAMLHKALNRKLQGSAADMMKRAMLKAWDDGVFAETGIPRLTVHDELDFSDPGNRNEAFRELKNILETCMPLRIPVKADCDIGPDWGHVEDFEKWAAQHRS